MWRKPVGRIARTGRFALLLLSLLLSLVVVSTVGVAQAAATHDPHETVHPQVLWQWTPHPDQRNQALLRITMRAPRNAWGIRRVARHVNRSVAGIHIYAGRGARCTDRPTTRCVVVHVGRYGEIGWAGRAEHVDEHRRRIRLNLDKASTQLFRQHMACHELGHVLGLMHHQQEGCVRSRHNLNQEVRYVSPVELDALRAFYDRL
jgi:hypothetical protein